jgi:hypothetical protein
MSIATAAADVLQQLQDAGVRAYDDARDINPPCVFLVPPEGVLRFHKGTADCTWQLYLVTGDAGARTATRHLSDLMDQVAGLFAFTTFERVALAVPGAGDPLPSYRLTWKSLTPIGA